MPPPFKNPRYATVANYTLAAIVQYKILSLDLHKAKRKISTTKTEIQHRSTKPDQCCLQVIGVPSKQVKKFEYFGCGIISDER